MDSSALVKLYADEPGHEEVRRLDEIVVSLMTGVEVPSAMWRKHRLGELDAQHVQILVAAFEADLIGRDARFVVIELVAGLLDDAARMCGTHGLRACDAVQLATGVAARAADPACGTFACFDEELREAAAAEGFLLLPA